MQKTDTKILSFVEWFSIIFAVCILAITWFGGSPAAGLNVLCSYLLVQWFIIIVSRIIAGIFSNSKSRKKV